MADLQEQARESGREVSLPSLEETAMSEILGTRRDWATGIGPLIPRSDMLEAQAHDSSSSSVGNVSSKSSSDMEEKLAALQQAVFGMAAGLSQTPDFTPSPVFRATLDHYMTQFGPREGDWGNAGASGSEQRPDRPSTPTDTEPEEPPHGPSGRRAGRGRRGRGRR